MNTNGQINCSYILILHCVVMTSNIFVRRLGAICVCSFTKVWVTESWTDWLTRELLHTHTHTHSHRQTHTGKHTLSPSPVNVWNKWLLQRRQCEQTTMSHLIGWLHENLFVLDRVCNNQLVSLREFGWPWMTAPHRTEQRHDSTAPRGKDEDHWYKPNDNNGPTTQKRLNVPNPQILSRSEVYLHRLIPPPFLAVWFLCCRAQWCNIL